MWETFYSFYWFQLLFMIFSPIKFLPHPTSFIYGLKVHGQSFYWIKLLCHYQKIFIFQFNVYFTEDHWQRERKRVQRKKIWFKCIFLTNTIFFLRIKNGYLDVSGWWNLVQFRRWWEWAGDRILIWTFKNKVYTSQAGGGLRRGGGCDDIPREILLRTFKLSKNKCLEELPLFGFNLTKKFFILHY